MGATRIAMSSNEHARLTRKVDRAEEIFDTKMKNKAFFHAEFAKRWWRQWVAVWRRIGERVAWDAVKKQITHHGVALTPAVA